MPEINREALNREFNPGVLRKKRGQGGRELSYIPCWAVIERLNETLGIGEWSWKIISREVLGESVVVFGEIHALGQIFSGEDCADIVKSKTGGLVPDALANAWKTASSGALVRAARLLGVGIYLYRGGELSEVELDEREEQRSESRKAPGSSQNGHRAPSPQGQSTPVNGPHGPASERQMAAVKAMARKLKLSDQALDQMCRQRYQHGLAEVTRENASDMISGMQQRLNGVSEEAA